MNFWWGRAHTERLANNGREGPGFLREALRLYVLERAGRGTRGLARCVSKCLCVCVEQWGPAINNSDSIAAACTRTTAPTTLPKSLETRLSTIAGLW